MGRTGEDAKVYSTSVKPDRGGARKYPEESERAGHMLREAGPYYRASTEGCARVGYKCDTLSGLLPMSAP